MPQELIENTIQTRRNESASNEAIRLMSVINARYPLLTRKGVGARRYQGDIAVLKTLPGERFRISMAEIASSRKNLQEDSEWLAKHLGEEFSDSLESLNVLHEQPDLIGWNAETLDAVEASVIRLESHLAGAATDYLADLADRFALVDGEKSEAIRDMVFRLQSNKDAIWTRLKRLQTRHERTVRNWQRLLLPDWLRR